VAASYPHKNLRRLIEAFPLESGDAGRVPLALVGLTGRAQRSVRAAARTRGHLIRVLGWVDDALLAALYLHALALAFPSL